MPITPLDPFWFSNRGLPTVFDQEIDYFTILSQLRGKINDTITLIDELEAEVTSMSSEFESIKSRLTAVEAKLDTIEAELKAYIDEQIEGVEERLDEKLEAYKAQIDAEIVELIADLNRFKSEIESEITDFDTRLDQFNDYMVNRFQELTNYINSTEDALRALLQVEIDDLQNQIDNLVFELPDIYNPVEGYDTSIQQAILDLYNLAQSDAITAQEFDALEITAAEFDALEITARDFDLHAKSILTT